MRSLFFMVLTTVATSLMLVACHDKDEGTKDAEMQQARIAFDRCVAVKGQAYCNSGKAGAMASITEFYGHSYYYSFYGANNYLAANANAVVYNADQVNAYFENYLKTASKADIMLMSNRWYQMTTEVNTLVTPLSYGRRCTVYGCY